MNLGQIFPSTRAVALGIANFLLVALCFTPTLYMFGHSFFDAAGELSLASYQQLISIATEPRGRELLLSSVALGAGAAGLSTLLGFPLGILLARADFSGKRFWRAVFLAPLVVPPYILALAWILASGKTGFLTSLTGIEFPANWTYSLGGAIVVLGTSYFPLSMLATEAAARRVGGRQEEAALLYRNAGGVLRHITLPLVAPTVLATALIIFVLATVEFGVPGLLRVRVFTTEVFTAFAAFYDFSQATALTIPLLLVTLFAGTTAFLLVGEYDLTARRHFAGGLAFSLGRTRWIVFSVLALVFLVAVVLPLVSLWYETEGFSQILTAVGGSATALMNSLVLSGLGATLVVSLAIWLAYGRARSTGLHRHFYDLSLVVIFAVPSTVVGIGLIGLWNRPDWRGAVYTSPFIIVIAYLARFVPLATLLLVTSFRQVPTSQEEAAEIAGAGWLRTFFRIVLPQIRQSLIAVWIIVFIFCFGELGATLLVAPPGESTLPVRIYTLIANSTPSEVAALALLQAILVLLPLIVLSLFFRFEKGERGQ